MHQPVISVNVNDDQEDAARKIQKYDLLAILLLMTIINFLEYSLTMMQLILSPRTNRRY
jgi:hypothetical protein